MSDCPERKREFVSDDKVDLSLKKHAILQGHVTRAVDLDRSWEPSRLAKSVGNICDFLRCCRASDFCGEFLTKMTGDVGCAYLVCALLHETVHSNWSFIL